MNDEQVPALRQEVENMATMREAYDNLSQAAEAYNTGKTELVANLIAKGMEASATETLPELAEKVAAISQESYTIQGGEIYGNQLFGGPDAPKFWNLYDVLMQLLSDGRLVQYGGILLAEYYRGYDSLALAGAGAGGAYVVSDLDENGQFKMYTEDTMHTWATEFDGHGNRWVAYCFADEYHDFQITDTNTSPRSIFIGRKVGTITSLVNGRSSEIVVPNGNKLKDIQTGAYQQNFGRVLVLRNIEEHASGSLIYLNTAQKTEQVYIKISKVSGGILIDGLNGVRDGLLGAVIVCPEFNGQLFRNYANGDSSIQVITLNIQRGYVSITGSANAGLAYLKTLNILNVSNLEVRQSNTGTYRMPADIYITAGDDDKSAGLRFTYGGYNSETWSLVSKIEVRQGWCKPLDIRYFTGLTKENVQVFLFNKLGINETPEQTPVAITIATAVLNLFTQEEIDAVVERTNITIVGV